MPNHRLPITNHESRNINMKIIIAGAGDIGFHLAKLLSYEKHDITLIDQKQEMLDHANKELDVFTIKGDSSSLEILTQAGADECKLFLAVTTSEKNNLMSAILAKKMGAKQTIARVNSDEYLREEQREIFSDLGIDKLISPQKLAAIEERFHTICAIYAIRYVD